MAVIVGEQQVACLVREGAFCISVLSPSLQEGRKAKPDDVSRLTEIGTSCNKGSPSHCRTICHVFLHSTLQKKKKIGFFSVIVLPTSRYDFPGMKKRPYGAEKTALGKDVGAVSAGTRDSGWGTSPLASVPSDIQLGVR